MLLSQSPPQLGLPLLGGPSTPPPSASSSSSMSHYPPSGSTSTLTLNNTSSSNRPFFSSTSSSSSTASSPRSPLSALGTNGRPRSASDQPHHLLSPPSSPWPPPPTLPSSPHSTSTSPTSSNSTNASTVVPSFSVTRHAKRPSLGNRRSRLSLPHSNSSNTLLIHQRLNSGAYSGSSQSQPASPSISPTNSLRPLPSSTSSPALSTHLVRADSLLERHAEEGVQEAMLKLTGSSGSGGGGGVSSESSLETLGSLGIADVSDFGLEERKASNLRLLTTIRRPETSRSSSDSSHTPTSPKPSGIPVVLALNASSNLGRSSSAPTMAKPSSSSSSATPNTNGGSDASCSSCSSTATTNTSYETNASSIYPSSGSYTPSSLSSPFSAPLSDTDQDDDGQPLTRRHSSSLPRRNKKTKHQGELSTIESLDSVALVQVEFPPSLGPTSSPRSGSGPKLDGGEEETEDEAFMSALEELDVPEERGMGLQSAEEGNVLGVAMGGERQTSGTVVEEEVDSSLDVKGKGKALGREVGSSKGDKRLYKLWELVEGEVAYTEDLVTLVHIYLHHLYLLPSFSPARRSVIARNTLDILMLHKRFTKALVSILEEEGIFDGQSDVEEQNLVGATRRIAAEFVQEAEDFSAYEEYCSGHDEALAVIRSVELSPEWTAYERKCSALTASRERPTLSDLLSYAASTATNPNSSSSAAVTEFDWSFSSRSGTELPRTASSSSLHYDMASANRAAAAAAEGGGTSRLMLRDLLIKPIQRICRYPLVLASLLGCQVDYEKRDGEEEVGEDLERALGSMRVVAEGVDEATRRKASKERTKLILQRMEPHMVLTPSIIASLGECLLAGCLEVIYQHATYAPLIPPVKVRYLAAFLYAGYLSLCKVKKGKIYQATFFTPLASMTIMEGGSNASEVFLPESIRLNGPGFSFELATSCRREKLIWLDALRNACQAETNWKTKPPTSAPEIFPPRQINRRMSSYTGSTPPISPSSPPGKRLSMPGGAEPPLVSDENPVFDDPDSAAPSAVATPSVSEFPQTASQKTSPAPAITQSITPSSVTDPNPQLLFRRSSATYREAVERSLADVFSESCSTARNLAQLDRRFRFDSSPSKPSHHSLGNAVSSVRRKIGSREGSLGRRSSFVELRSRTISGMEDVPTELPTASSVASAGAAGRVKSEGGSRRENFFRRSTVLPSSWQFEDGINNSSPVDHLISDDGGLHTAFKRSKTGKTKTAPRQSDASGVEVSPAPSHSRQVSDSPTELQPPNLLPSLPTPAGESAMMVPIKTMDGASRSTSSFQSMKNSLRRTSSFVEGWTVGASSRSRQTSAPAGHLEPTSGEDGRLLARIQTGNLLNNRPYSSHPDDLSPFTSDSARLPPPSLSGYPFPPSPSSSSHHSPSFHRAHQSAPNSASASTTTLNSTNTSSALVMAPSYRIESKTSTIMGSAISGSSAASSRPGLIKRSLSSLSRRRYKSSTNLPSLHPELVAHANASRVSLANPITLPSFTPLSPLELPSIENTLSLSSLTRNDSSSSHSHRDASSSHHPDSLPSSSASSAADPDEASLQPHSRSSSSSDGASSFYVTQGRRGPTGSDGANEDGGVRSGASSLRSYSVASSSTGGSDDGHGGGEAGGGALMMKPKRRKSVRFFPRSLHLTPMSNNR